MKKENHFNFIFDKIKEHCESLNSFQEKILYLELVKKDYLQQRNSLFGYDGFGEPLNKMIDFEIKYLEKENIIEREKYKGFPDKNETKAKNRIEWKLSQTSY